MLLCTKNVSLPGYEEKYALWYLLPFSSFQKCVGWQGIGFKQTSSPLSPHTGLPVPMRTHKNTHTRTQISQEQKIKLESFGNTLPQHIDTFGHTQLETHTDTHKKAFSDKKNRYISPCAVSHTQRT